MKKQTNIQGRIINGTLQTPELKQFEGEYIYGHIVNMTANTVKMIMRFRNVLLPQIESFETNLGKHTNKRTIETECILYFSKQFNVNGLIPQEMVLIHPETNKPVKVQGFIGNSLENFSFETMKTFLQFVENHYAEQGLIWKN